MDSQKDKECQGNCSIRNYGCQGKVKRVHVKSPPFFIKTIVARKTVLKDCAIDWGYFNYCETAISEDLKNNFVVSYVNEDGSETEIKD